MRYLIATCLLAFATACGGGGGSQASAPPPPPPAPVANADITLLFMGNSHTAYHDVPGTVAALVRGARPGRTVVAQQAPGGMFLDERASDPANLALLEQRWTFVVLQAQKYSTSGLFSYPIEGAVEIARRARSAGAVPVMFPEWPRRGIDETQRIFDLHVSIAQRVPACVAPVGQAWDRALAQYPGLVLHDADGNHSAPAGAFLAAVVIAATMTGARPDTFPFVPSPGVDGELQARLRAVAAETVALHPPRQWCPSDPLPP